MSWIWSLRLLLLSKSPKFRRTKSTDMKKFSFLTEEGIDEIEIYLSFTR